MFKQFVSRCIGLRTIGSTAVLAAVSIGVLAAPRVSVAAEPQSVVLYDIGWQYPWPEIGDILVFTGKPLGSIDTWEWTTGDACAPFAIQQIVIIDPGGQRPAQIVQYVLVGRAEPLEPGTRLVCVQVPWYWPLDLYCTPNGDSRQDVMESGVVFLAESMPD